MNGYVEAGYIVVLGSLATYATSIVVRERQARRRLREHDGVAPVAESNDVDRGDGSAS